MQRVKWIDFFRGISMIIILIFHTETYYKDNNVTPYYVYTTNAIILFYFISGWLFYKEKDFSFKHKVKSILHSLIIPYFLFATIIAIIKPFIRHKEIEWQEIIESILLGRASWFITALIVAELLFSVFLIISKNKKILLLLLVIICFIIYFIIPFNVYNIWQWQDALLAVFYLYIGYFVHQNKNFINYISKPLYSIILLSILILIKLLEYKLDLTMRNIAIENILLFMADTMIWLVFILSIIRYIPHSRLIEWTGKHSLVYYFIAGGVPLVISNGLNSIGLPYNNYLSFILAISLVYFIATIIVWIIDKSFSLFNINKYIRI